MRVLFSAVAAFSLILAASPAAASQIAVAPAAISAELQEDLEDDYGVREGEYLQERLAERLSRALANAGADLSENAPITVEATIVDARPNRPTFKQLGDTVSLSYSGSISIGGAELTAVLRGADGQVLREVSHRHYSYSLEDVSFAADSWYDARRAINGLARKVADAYLEQSRQAAR